MSGSPALAARMARLGTESAFEVLIRANALEATGRSVIHLELGEPDFETPAHIVEEAAEAMRGGATHYVPAPGINPLREAVAEFREALRLDPSLEDARANLARALAMIKSS